MHTFNIFLGISAIRRKKIIYANICYQNQTPNDSSGIYKILKGRRNFSKIKIIDNATQTYYL